MWQAGFPWMRPTRVQLGVLSAADRAQRAGYLHQASLRLGLFWEPNSPILGDFWTWKPPIFSVTGPYQRMIPKYFANPKGWWSLCRQAASSRSRDFGMSHETSAASAASAGNLTATPIPYSSKDSDDEAGIGDGSILWWYSCQLLWCSKLLYSGCLLGPLWLVPGLLSCRLVARSLALGIVDNKAGRARTALSTSGISSFQGEFCREMRVLFEHGVPNPLVNHQFPIEMAGCYTPLWDIPTSGIALLPPGIDWVSV